MKPLAFAAIALACAIGPASAGDAGEAYHARFRTLGFTMRATYACPVDKRKALERIGDSATSDSRAFAQAFPKVVQGWMEEGADLFNRGVMKAGITRACAEIR